MNSVSGGLFCMYNYIVQTGKSVFKKYTVNKKEYYNRGIGSVASTKPDFQGKCQMRQGISLSPHHPIFC